MKMLLKTLGYLVGLIVLVVAGTLIGARFADGPLEIIAGGPFTSGEQATEEPDWSPSSSNCLIPPRPAPPGSPCMIIACSSPAAT